MVRLFPKNSYIVSIAVFNFHCIFLFFFIFQFFFPLLVTRGTKELSSTLEEFRGGVRILQRGKSVVNPDDTTDGSSFTQPSPKMTKRQDQSEDQVDHNMEQGASPASLKSPNSGEESNLIRPFVMQFHIVLTKLTVSAALLPSLQGNIYFLGGNLKFRNRK